MADVLSVEYNFIHTIYHIYIIGLGIQKVLSAC